MIGIASEDLDLDSTQGLDASERIDGEISPSYHQWLHNNAWIYDQYERIGIFNDTIKSNPRTLNALFQYTELLDLYIAQPALTSASQSDHVITKQHGSFLHRWTNFVEFLCPIFQSRILKECADGFKLHAGNGKGIETFWLTKCSPIVGKLAIIDALPVTRCGYSEPKRPKSESQRQQEISHHRTHMTTTQTGITPSKDNLCAVTLDGNFLHTGEINFVNLINNDALQIDANSLSAKDPSGRFISSSILLNHYTEKTVENFDAFNNGGACDDLLEQLIAIAIATGITYEQLKTISNAPTR
ncbi:MAG: hypothetical protein ACON4T_02175 [Synechococcus sp.]